MLVSINNVPIVQCLLQPCNGGECVNKIGSYQCNCRRGTSGVNCEHLTGTSCNGVTCSNHSKCITRHRKQVCQCNNGYSGTNCSVNNFCLCNQCKNNSTCVIGESNYIHTLCYCPKGFNGQFCEQIDFCASNPCHNSGICINTAFNFSCNCVNNFMGPTCKAFLKLLCRK